MRPLLKGALVVLLAVAIALASAWAGFALWYRLPVPDATRGLAAGIFGLFGLVTIISLFTHRRVPAVLAFLVAFGAVSLWWQTIKPIAQVDWAPMSRGRSPDP